MYLAPILLLATAAQGAPQGPAPGPDVATPAALVVAIATIVANVIIAVVRARAAGRRPAARDQSAPVAVPDRFEKLAVGDVSFPEVVRRLQAAEGKIEQLERQLEAHEREQHRTDIELAKTLKSVEIETGRLIKLSERRDAHPRE